MILGTSLSFTVNLIAKPKIAKTKNLRLKTKSVELQVVTTTTKKQFQNQALSQLRPKKIQKSSSTEK